MLSLWYKVPSRIAHCTPNLVQPEGKPVMFSTDTVRAELRPKIAAYIKEAPERSLVFIELDELSTFSKLAREEQFAVATQLDGYTGAACKTPEFEIPCRYRIYPMIASKRMEVVLLKSDVEGPPEAILADDAAAFVSKASEKLDVNEVLELTLPEVIIEQRGEMTSTQKTRFRALVKQRLVKAGLMLREGYLNSSFKIRRIK